MSLFRLPTLGYITIALICFTALVVGFVKAATSVMGIVIPVTIGCIIGLAIAVRMVNIWLALVAAWGVPAVTGLCGYIAQQFTSNLVGVLVGGVAGGVALSALGALMLGYHLRASK